MTGREADEGFCERSRGRLGQPFHRLPGVLMADTEKALRFGWIILGRESRCESKSQSSVLSM